MEKDTTEIKSGHIYEWGDIKNSGLDKERFIKVRSEGSIGLLNSIVFVEKTYFPNFTFVHFKGTNKFKAEENGYSEEKANHQTKIRNMEWAIEGVENTIWAYKFEFNDKAPIPALEADLADLKKQLLDLLNKRK